MSFRTASLLTLLIVLALPAAAQTRTFTTSADFQDGGTLFGVSLPIADQVVLGPTAVSSSHTVWSTNYLYGYVVRMDSLTGRQTGRYDSALVSINGQPTGAQPAQTYCDFATTGNCPGRVAVDANGDVWIVNRAFGQQGTLTKFSGDRSHCIDRNNNGVIDTSSDVNGDGLISVVPAAGEYFGQQDECILTTFKVGPVNVFPRGVAVDKYGKIWVSTHNDGKLYRYNPVEPIVLEATVTVGGNPYSLATGGDYVFVSNSAGAPRRVNITTLAVSTLSACTLGTYGIVAEPGGNRAYLGSYFASTSGVYRADFTNNTCTLLGGPAPTTAVTLDLQGNVWSANYSNASVSKFSPTGVLLGSYPAGGANPHGLSVDFQGNVWVVIHSPPALVKLNAATGAIITTASLAAPGIPNADPYNYSDFTGVQIDRQAPYGRVGTWSAVVDGSRAQLPWKSLGWNTEPQGAVPAQTSLSLSVRAADDLTSLATSSYSPASNNVVLADIKGRYLQVQATFAGPGFVTPVLSDLVARGPCTSPGEACCVTDADCTDADACSLDVCPVPGGACTHAPQARCCLTVADCDDRDACTDDVCPGAGLQCTSTPRADCCTTSAQCADADPCTVDVCSGPGGTCSHQVIAACCRTVADCSGGSVCAVASCPAAGSVCVTTPIVGCCTADAQCADTDACTSNVCELSSGTCRSAPLAGCCNGDAECNDGNTCTQDRCSGLGGVCVTAPIAGCCTSATQCDDGNSCTDDGCSASGTCEHTTRASCCRTRLDCDDGQRCTQDECVAELCTHPAIAACCATAADCAEGVACVSGYCGAVPDAGGPEMADAGLPMLAKGSGCGCAGFEGGWPFAGALLMALALRRRSPAH